MWCLGTEHRECCHIFGLRRQINCAFLAIGFPSRAIRRRDSFAGSDESLFGDSHWMREFESKNCSSRWTIQICAELCKSVCVIRCSYFALVYLVYHMILELYSSSYANECWLSW